MKESATKYVARYAASTGDGGFTVEDAASNSGLSIGSIRDALCRAVKAGALHKAVLAHKVVRYFRDANAAAVYQLKHEVRRPAVDGVSIKGYTRAPWTEDTPVDLSRAKITVCPSPKEFGPAAKLYGVGK